eukprot:2737200-Rhodomonas_salina.4
MACASKRAASAQYGSAGVGLERVSSECSRCAGWERRGSVKRQVTHAVSADIRVVGSLWRII